MYLSNGHNEVIHSVQHTIDSVRITSHSLQLRTKNVVELFHSLHTWRAARAHGYKIDNIRTYIHSPAAYA